MNNEKTGDRVFTNIDQALAERIVARSKENSKETAPATGGNPVDSDIDGTARTNGITDFPMLPEGSLPVVKIAALLLALLVVMLLFFRRKE